MAVRTIATELTLGGEHEFNAAMKSVNNNVKNLKTEMAAVSSEFRKNENSTEALRAKQKVLQDQYKQQQVVVEAFTKRLAKVKEAYGEDSAEADKYQQKLNAAKIALDKAKDALDQNTEALSKHGPIIGSVSDQYGKLKGKLEDAKKSVDSAIKRVPVLGDAYELSGKAASTMAKGTVTAFSAIAKAAAGLTAAGVAAVGGVAAIGGAALQTLTGYATDAASRSKDAYDKANELAEKARKEALDGNEEASMEYLRQADELIASIDEDYLRLGNSLDVLSKSSTAAKDALGKILLPALQELTDQGAALLQSFSLEMENAAGDTEKMGRIMADYLRQGIALLREQIPAFGQIAVELLEGLGAGLEENLPQMLDDILAILDYILTTLADHADELGSAAATIVTTLTKFLIEHAPDLIVGGAELILQIIAGLAQALPDLIAEFLSLPGKLLNAFQAADIDWSTLGHNIVAGIWNGFVNTFETVKGWIRNAVNGLFGDVETDQDINSPSKKWAKGIGRPIAQGVGVGFVDAMQDVSRDMQRAMGSAMPGADAMRFNASVDAGSAAAGTGGGSTSMGGVSIVINGYNVKDDDELAEILSYKLQQLLDRKEA